MFERCRPAIKAVFEPSAVGFETASNSEVEVEKAAEPTVSVMYITDSASQLGVQFVIQQG